MSVNVLLMWALIEISSRTEIAAIFAICDCDAGTQTPEIAAISETRESNAALRFKGTMESR